MPETVANIPDALRRKLDEMTREHDRIEAQLGDAAVSADHRKVRDLSIKRASIEPVVNGWREYLKLAREADELEGVIAAGEDAEFVAIARQELPELRARAAGIIDTVKASLVNSDDRSVGSVILEIRAGTGGDEAALWARDLLDI